MKKLTKTLLSLATVSAMTAAMAASVSAMEASYVKGNVTITDIADTGASQTMLILSKDEAVTSDNTTIVKAIDQKDGSTFEGVAIPVDEDLGVGTYYVRVSGTNGNLQQTTFEVKSETPDPPETPSEGTALLVGNADGNNRITANDSIKILQHVANPSAGIIGSDVTSAVAYSDGNNRITANDSIKVLQYIANKSAAEADTNNHVGESKVFE